MGRRGSRGPSTRNHPLSLSLSLSLSFPGDRAFSVRMRERGVETADIVPDVSDRVENQALANPLPTATIR